MRTRDRPVRKNSGRDDVKKGASMKRILFSLLMGAVALGTSSLISAEEKKEQVTVKGWVTDTECGAKGATEGHADCAKKCVKEKGAKWALYDPETKTVWVIADQAKASEMAGKKVAAKGMADMKTKEIWVDSFTPF
jgi:hypothetical protein